MPLFELCCHPALHYRLLAAGVVVVVAVAVAVVVAAVEVAAVRRVARERTTADEYAAVAHI
eukprot:COSAG05_NODE_18_length_34957_cov_44.338115_20_plen_61_part_00